MSRREGLLSLRPRSACSCWACCPGVVLAVVLSLFWLLATAMRPKTPCWAGFPGLQGYHSIADYPQAETLPGLLLYPLQRQSGVLQHRLFCERVRAAIRRAATPVAWVIVDLSPVNFVDATAVQRFDELRRSCGTRHPLGMAHAKRQLGRHLRDAMGGGAPFDPEGARFSDPAVRGSGFRGASGRLRNGDHGADCDAAILDDQDAEGQYCSRERYVALSKGTVQRRPSRGGTNGQQAARS